MNRFNIQTILREEANPSATPGGGNGAPSTLSTPSGGVPATHWASSLPEDLRGHDFVRNSPDLATFTKSALETKRMVGNSIRVPGKDATPEERADFFNKLGRPDSPAKYSTSQDKKLPDGVNIPEKDLEHFKNVFHTANLTTEQAQIILDSWYDHVGKEHGIYSESNQKRIAEGLQQLEKEFGGKDKLQANIDIARATIRRFSDNEFVQWLDNSGMGNEPAMIRLFSKIGQAVMDDPNANTPGGLSGFLGGREGALAEINNLKLDKEFQSALMNRRAPGHSEAVERWTRLHGQAYGQEKVKPE